MIYNIQDIVGKESTIPALNQLSDVIRDIVKLCIVQSRKKALFDEQCEIGVLILILSVILGVLDGFLPLIME